MVHFNRSGGIVLQEHTIDKPNRHLYCIKICSQPQKVSFSCRWPVVCVKDFDAVEMAVGFVDGVFLQDYPPTPIEVNHLARKNGVLLAGAASLGALRDR